MKKTDVTRASCWVSLFAVVCGMLVLTAMPDAAYGVGYGSNTVPYAESFENFTNGTLIVGATNGWYALDEDAVKVFATNYSGSYSIDYPIPSPTRSNVMQITSLAENVFETMGWPTLQTNYVDFVLQPRQWDADTPPPTETNNVLTAIYVTSNGNLSAYCSYSSDGGETYSNLWVVFPQVSISTDQWIRLTISLSFNPSDEMGPSGLDFFQIRYNNSAFLTNYYGQTMPNGWNNNGSWFTCAKRDGHAFHSIGVSGSGMLDDLVLTTNQPGRAQTWNVKVIADAGSTTIPDGSPSGINESRTNGANLTVSWTNQTGYTITNVAWGEGLGAEFATNTTTTTPTSHTFTAISTNYTIRVFTHLEPRYLVISNSPGTWGAPNPTTNVVHTYNFNESVTCSIAGSPFNDGSWTQQVVGYVRTTSSPEGTMDNPIYATNMNFNIVGSTTSDITRVTWIWKPQYWLNTEVSGEGTVDMTDQWCTNGQAVTVTATTNAGATFDHWGGDTNGASFPSTNQIEVTMNRARTITAYFTSGSGSQVTTNGTSHIWIGHFTNTTGWTSADFDAWETNDYDSDMLLNWQEYLAGTDPTNSNSVFVVLGQGTMGLSNYVRFFGADFTNYGVMLPFGMLRCTNLVTTPWGSSIGSIDRSGAVNGTNTWWDIDPPSNVPVFYRPVATNVW